MESKLETVQSLFQKHFGDVDGDVDADDPNSNSDSDGTTTTSAIAVAPGRVNLIGEHTDYTGGFVLPFAIDYSTIVYGRGSISSSNGNGNGSGNGKRGAKLSFVSALTPDSLEVMECSESSSVPPQPVAWTSYVLGTVFQYLPDLPEGAELRLEFCISGDVPLGSGLSSSASLEVAVARFVEAVLGDHAFSSEPNGKSHSLGFSPSKTRALRCQKAENEWCNSPCGIMDQAISSAATSGSLLLIDCRTLDFVPTKMAETSLVREDPVPVLVVANSNVKHSIGGGEYPVRVAQCKAATEALRRTNPGITLLRDATPEDVEAAMESGAFSDYDDDDDDETRVSYLRARHVTTENERTLRAREDLEAGDWASVGALMNASHSSMRDDYEVSCEEVDILVGIARDFPGVYGSRLTGGGFGGCTVTLVAEDRAEELMEHMRREYKAETGIDCPCFVTRPARGAHLLSFTDHKPLVEE
eukprot:CAMPEP_0172361132 /NCGR_PEP_ID=MMETSP1060-20121228/5019_1 /TAXON_ID=37318 /ORGANISM="Pseudo-nitzschia pungens, Strain cf. cingulata" /LENGTH=471 /DNA_ID=CAMNT_0013083301 /DNA_START=484 /DNA_END=1899 /DNA_ORIENTATION=+